MQFGLRLGQAQPVLGEKDVLAYCTISNAAARRFSQERDILIRTCLQAGG